MAKQLEELDQLKDQINPAYLSGVCSSRPAPHPQKVVPATTSLAPVSLPHVGLPCAYVLCVHKRHSRPCSSVHMSADLPKSQASLQPLREIHIQQLEDQGELAVRIDALLATYNNFVMDVSAKFVGIDAALTSKGY